ncbi:nascent polypeptide-associated complex subunit alpha, muscle-specific form-like [Sorghum bicolor]|uniref:nascent polypeptide-associated complex subunit alpha, muscle-specific form-like n=1 Tax=Sorghum bicolor TaxID=4558 RepID=UPI000B4261EA|nr:nascent polypeptide-associated complex subunit alpha, muscle-specific form-like [Sorghum bicolor]|eukprot:XP_021305432.1 nascent polypeptide-associated complex subunit alpha, muscle-specific form-like [Sorghum bicolor]
MAGTPPGLYAPPGAFYQAPPVAPPAWSPSPWTSESLANAFSTVALTPPANSSDWVIDSGASSHIASNPGSPFPDNSSSLYPWALWFLVRLTADWIGPPIASAAATRLPYSAHDAYGTRHARGAHDDAAPATPAASAASTTPAPSAVPATPAAPPARPPIIHVYTRRPPVASTPPVLTTGAAPRRSSIIPTPPRYIKHGPPVPPAAVPIPPVLNSHGMATRGKSGYRQPRLALLTEARSPIPRSCHDALTDPH